MSEDRKKSLNFLFRSDMSRGHLALNRSEELKVKKKEEKSCLPEDIGLLQ